jgi:monovalent cation:H+ antiporter-2, CPA2 family
MHQFPLLHELLVISSFGVVITILVARFKLPMVAGLLLTGALIGPHGLGFVRHAENVQAIAGLGVTLLLFSIGLEFPVRRLLHVFRASAWGGFLQVLLTVAWVAGVFLLLDYSFSKSLLFGFIGSLSSTAIVMNLLSARGELDAPHGRLTVGILIFQDLCIIPMILLVPVLAGSSDKSWEMSLIQSFGSALFVALITLYVARKVIPAIFRAVDATRMREVFLLAVLGVCLGTTWITSRYGLSGSLGAFLAGVILADSDFGDRAMSDVLPLRSVFISIFFVSLGMLVNFETVMAHPLAVALVFIAFVIGKGFINSIAAMAIRFPSRIAWLSGVSLAQFGEFGFVLAELGLQNHLLKKPEFDILLAAGVFSMFITPIAMILAPRFNAGEKILQPLERLLGVRGIDEATPEHAHISNHVVIAGYGVGGQILAEGLGRNKTPYLILELNSEKVIAERKKGTPIYYGDITSREAMKHAGVDRARALVLLINDPQGARRALSAIRHFSPNIHIFVRSRYFSDRIPLKNLGVDYVITEEFESAVKMTSMVLEYTGSGDRDISEFVHQARKKYEADQA